jgi:hypothetical protein
MPPGCRTARFAPEDAACHWNLFDNNCGAFCAACKGGCNAHCPITFEKVTLALVSEKCATPPAGTAQVVIRGIRFIPKDCACTANEDCAGSSDRPRCAQDMLTSMLCPTGSSGCGVCAPEVPCPAEGKTCEVRLSNTVCPGVLHCHGGTAACHLADPACAGM